ncbi:hypothetical protein D3C72_1947760 [compost metagenome]
MSPVLSTSAAMVMWPSAAAAVVNSCGTTVSRPVGMMAPVMIFTHSPAATVPAQALPASAVPTTRKVRGWPATSCAPANA